MGEGTSARECLVVCLAGEDDCCCGDGGSLAESLESSASLKGGVGGG